MAFIKFEDFFIWHSDEKTLLFTHKNKMLKKTRPAATFCGIVKNRSIKTQLKLSCQVGMVLNLTRDLNQFSVGFKISF